jgi:ribose 5-phosphate isomerase RpiB
MKIAIGCDENALELKNALIDILKAKGAAFKDC